MVLTVAVTVGCWAHVALASSVVLDDWSDRPLIGWPLLIALTFPMIVCWGYIERIVT